jgi:hypothetical protein
MANKNIPEVGEVFNGHIPAIKKIAHVTYGVASGSPDVEVGEIAVYKLIEVSVPIIVFGLWTQIEEAFTASVTGDLGDSADVDRYSADGTIVTGTSGAVLIGATGLAVPYILNTGLDIELNLAGASALAGLAHVYVEYAELVD